MKKIPLYRRLHFKLIASFGALILIGSLIANAISVQMTERELIKLVDQQFENTTGMVEGFFSTIGQMAQIWGNHFITEHPPLEAIKRGDKAKIAEQLVALQKQSTADVVVWLDKDGKVIYDSFEPKHEGHSLMSWSIVRRAVTDNESGWGVISDLGNFIIYGSAPLTIGDADSSELYGVVLVGYVINDTLLQQIKRDTEIDITIVRRRAVMASTFNNLQRRLATVPLSYLEYQTLLNEQGHLGRLPIDGITYLAEADSIETMNPTMEGSIMLTYPEANLNEIKDRLITGFSMIAVIIFILALFISMRLASGILAPLRQLLAFSERTDSTTESRQSSSERFQISAKDEVGALADHFNRLIDTLEKRNIELENARESANKANKAKSEFITNMGHELRTPLHAILSFSKMGTNKLDPSQLEKLGQYFDNISVSGERLHQLIKDLLDVSSLDAGMIGLDKREEDLLKVIAKAIEEHQKQIDAHKITITLTPPTGSAMAEFDPDRIGQVIGYLLSNAIKFSRDGQIIDISVADSAISDEEGTMPALLLSIKDRGVGIPEDELDSVFETFVQSSDTKTGAGGTGLGLAIAKGIIAEHGGEIWVNNLEGGGAAFHFKIPVK